MFKRSFKVHQKNDNNKFCAAQAKQRVNESVNESGESPSCSVYFKVESPGVVLILFKIPLFSPASICALSFISKLNAGSILKVKVASSKSDAILVAINKRINTNNNEASWATQWEAV